MNCISCNNEILNKRRQKYCSNECMYHYYNIKFTYTKCEECKKKFTISITRKADKIRGRFCSPQCRTSHHSKNILGSNHPKWKGGVAPEHDKIRNSSEYRDWRRKVFERDRFTCRVCLSKGYVQANHIYPFRSHIELRHDINNGITLCVECHKFIFKREYLFIDFFQGILKKGFNSAEALERVMPSQQERLRKALWACVTVSSD